MTKREALRQTTQASTLTRLGFTPREDARKYPCESCDAESVYGAQKWLLMTAC